MRAEAVTQNTELRVRERAQMVTQSVDALGRRKQKT